MKNKNHFPGHSYGQTWVYFSLFNSISSKICKNPLILLAADEFKSYNACTIRFAKLTEGTNCAAA